MSKKQQRGEWTAEGVQAILMNPANAGIGLYPRIVSDEQWIEANAAIIREVGATPYLRQLLAILRDTFGE